MIAHMLAFARYLRSTWYYLCLDYRLTGLSSDFSSLASSWSLVSAWRSCCRCACCCYDSSFFFLFFYRFTIFFVIGVVNVIATVVAFVASWQLRFSNRQSTLIVPFANITHLMFMLEQWHGWCVSAMCLIWPAVKTELENCTRNKETNGCRWLK